MTLKRNEFWAAYDEGKLVIETYSYPTCDCSPVLLKKKSRFYEMRKVKIVEVKKKKK